MGVEQQTHPLVEGGRDALQHVVVVVALTLLRLVAVLGNVVVVVLPLGIGLGGPFAVAVFLVL